MTTLFLSFLIACGGGPAPSEPAGAPEAEAPAGHREDIDVAAFHQRHGEGVALIDVRTEDEYAGGHVPGAINIPLDRLAADHPGLAGFDKGEPLHVICATGGRSARASDQLAKGGWHAVNVDGGTMGWIAAGHPTE